MEKSIELIEAKIKADKDRVISNFEGEPLVLVLNGRYGPFIQVIENKKKINIKIPKDKEPKSLSRKECLLLFNDQKKKK